MLVCATHALISFVSYSQLFMNQHVALSYCFHHFIPRATQCSHQGRRVIVKRSIDMKVPYQKVREFSRRLFYAEIF